MKKAVSQKLTSTRTRVSKRWATYRTKKKKILHRKKLSKDERKQIIYSEIDLTRQKISSDWSMYREIKYGIIYKSPYKGFRLIKKMTGSMFKLKGYDKPEYFKFHDTYQKIYKAKHNFNPDDLNTIIPGILKHKNVNGVTVVFEVTLKETGETVMVSDYITTEAWKRMQEMGDTIIDSVSKKFWSTKHYMGDLKFIYMRVIYKK